MVIPGGLGLYKLGGSRTSVNKEATPAAEPEAADESEEEVAPQTVGDLVQLAAGEADTPLEITGGGEDTGAGGGSQTNAGGEGEIL